MHYINNTKALNEALAQFKDTDFIAIDTEFISEKTYIPNLCLIQIATKDQTFIIDTLADNLDTTCFVEILLNADIKKVFHSARQDIEVFYKIFGIIPLNITDTQILAMACGYPEQISYNKLVKLLLDIDIPKTERMSNWDQRPLNKRQISYAEADVKYLHKIYIIITKQLQEMGRSDWCNEEIRKLLNEDTYKHSKDNIKKKLNFKNLSPAARYILLELAIWREEKAIKKNKPRKHIFRDEMMLEICRFMPQKIEELKTLRIHGNQILKRNDVNEIIEVVVRAKNYYENNENHINTLFEYNKPKNTTQKNNDLLDANIIQLASLLLQVISKEEGIAPKLLASNSEIEDFLNYKKREYRFNEGWRKNVLLEKLNHFRNGHLFLSYQNGTIALDIKKN